VLVVGLKEKKGKKKKEKKMKYGIGKKRGGGKRKALLCVFHTGLWRTKGGGEGGG